MGVRKTSQLSNLVIRSTCFKRFLVAHMLYMRELQVLVDPTANICLKENPVWKPRATGGVVPILPPLPLYNRKKKDSLTLSSVGSGVVELKIG